MTTRKKQTRKFVLPKESQDAETYLALGDEGNKPEHHGARRVYEVGAEPEQFDGSVGITPADTITFTRETREFWVQNTHGSQDILVSMDGGTIWWTIASGADVKFPARVTSIQVKGSGAATTYVGVGYIEPAE